MEDTMDTIKFDKGNARVIAHRGLPGLEKANTCAAYVAAGNRSYFAIECDVRTTADGVFVISHDNNLARVSGAEITVEDNTLQTLQNVLLYDTAGGKSRNDLRICTLENYLDICQQYDKSCILELKAYFTAEQLRAMVSVLDARQVLDRVIFISFHYDDLKKIRDILPNAKIQWLFKELTDETVNKLTSARFDAAVSSKILTEELVRQFHQNGLEVNTWVVNDRETAERFVAWGVDYITTNILE